MENTLENKVKFFAQYWGQRVMAVTVNEDKTRHKIGNSHMGKYHVECCHIELKPLSSITDEEALKIAELLSWQRISESAIIAQTKELLQPKQFQTNLYREQWSEIIDKVRELGYAHKWNGLSVEKQIEYGWIKLKSE